MSVFEIFVDRAALSSAIYRHRARSSYKTVNLVAVAAMGELGFWNPPPGDKSRTASTPVNVAAAGSVKVGVKFLRGVVVMTSGDTIHLQVRDGRLYMRCGDDTASTPLLS